MVRLTTEVLFFKPYRFEMRWPRKKMLHAQIFHSRISLLGQNCSKNDRISVCVCLLESRASIWNSLNWQPNLFFPNFSCHHSESVYGESGRWRAVASDCRIICEFHFSSLRGDLFIVLQEPSPPMWFVFICMNDTDFFIISLLFSSFYFLHAT